MKTPQAIGAFKTGLVNHDWQKVYVEDTNDAYNACLNMFLILYDRYRPLNKFTQNSKKRRKPWLTQGVEKACKKKKKAIVRIFKASNKGKGGELQKI